MLLALSAVLGTFGPHRPHEPRDPFDESVRAIILLIGLAVGVDYSMFYLKREREERAAGRSEEAALEAAAATSGRSVLISGLTVMVAMAGMFLTGDMSFASFGVATILVVAVAMLGSLTVLPALLSKLGDNVDRGARAVRPPPPPRRRRGPDLGRDHRPRPPPAVAVRRCSPAACCSRSPRRRCSCTRSSPGSTRYPQRSRSMKTYNRLQQAFPGTEIPANVVVRRQTSTRPRSSRHRPAQERGGRHRKMHVPITVDVNDGGTVANIAIPLDGNGTDAASTAALAALRDEIVPPPSGRSPGVEVGVTGLTAESKDFNAHMKSVAPLVFAFVLLFAFLLMLFAFRSLVIAAKAIVLNLLSVAAAYGMLVARLPARLGQEAARLRARPRASSRSSRSSCS